VLLQPHLLHCVMWAVCIATLRLHKRQSFITVITKSLVDYTGGSILTHLPVAVNVATSGFHDVVEESLRETVHELLSDVVFR
jgi:hypothetical protein